MRLFYNIINPELGIDGDGRMLFLFERFTEPPVNGLLSYDHLNAVYIGRPYLKYLQN
jgi:hypothetical protein